MKSLVVSYRECTKTLLILHTHKARMFKHDFHPSVSGNPLLALNVTSTYDWSDLNFIFHRTVARNQDQPVQCDCSLRKIDIFRYGGRLFCATGRFYQSLGLCASNRCWEAILFAAFFGDIVQLWLYVFKFAHECVLWFAMVMQRNTSKWDARYTIFVPGGCRNISEIKSTPFRKHNLRITIRSFCVYNGLNQKEIFHFNLSFQHCKNNISIYVFIMYT